MIEKNMVVQLEYQAKLEGVVVAHTHKPKLLLIGHERDLPPSLEQLLIGKTAPLEFNATMEHAYGIRDETKVTTVSASQLPIQNPVIGAKFSATDNHGQTLEARVIAIQGEQITVDMNHPRAGKTLEYSIKILSARVATDAELEHGHAHGDGGVTHSH
jgi:FKBP-type peptidyl-prolyl cis-trans isomerase SlyD